MARHELPARGRTSDGADVTIGEVDLGWLTQLAGWDAFDRAAKAMLEASGLTVPTDYRVPTRTGDATAWRVAPDRVLVRSATDPGLASTQDVAVLDLSQARICLSVSGPGAAGLLSRVVALDFSETAFPAGSFVQAGLHHVGVLIERGARESFDVLVPTTWSRSLTGFLIEHLRSAA